MSDCLGCNRKRKMVEPMRKVTDKEEMGEMVNCLEKYLPVSAMAHNILRMLIQGKLQMQVLVPHNQDKQDVKLCLLTCDLKMMQVVGIYYHPDHMDLLKRILSTTSFIGWSTSPSVLFMSFVEQTNSVVKEVCEEKQRVRTFNLLEEKSIAFFLPPEGLKEVPSLPDGYTLQSIKSEDLVTVYEVWKYSKVFSFEHFMQNLNELENSAIYFKEGEHEKMVGWIMEDDLGAIGKLNVYPEHRRKNLGSVLVANFSEAVKKQKKIPYALVARDNMASRNLFEKLGFTTEFYIHYHHSYAKQPS